MYTNKTNYKPSIPKGCTAARRSARLFSETARHSCTEWLVGGSAQLLDTQLLSVQRLGAAARRLKLVAAKPRDLGETDLCVSEFNCRLEQRWEPRTGNAAETAAADSSHGR